MRRGRPRTPIGTFGEITIVDLGDRYRATARFRDFDGRLRRVMATASSRRGAQARLKEKLVDRAGYGDGGVLGRIGLCPSFACTFAPSTPPIQS
jgi:hypothetical protein